MIVKTELHRVANIWLSLICEIEKKKTDKDIFASVRDRIWLLAYILWYNSEAKEWAGQ